MLRYKDFFDLLESFIGYINFFFFNDLVDENENIKFYLPFDNFSTKPTFTGIDEYLVYKNGVIRFIKAQNKRIDTYTSIKAAHQSASY
jgi:hypothetical protein